MTLDEAKTLLNDCERDELRDHAFGDREVSWFRKGVVDERGDRVEVATGYQGSDIGVSFPDLTNFEGDNARALFSCGTLTRCDRNDTQGDDNYIWRP